MDLLIVYYHPILVLCLFILWKNQKGNNYGRPEILVSAEQMGWSVDLKIWFCTALSSPTNMHQKLDVSLLPSAWKIGLPRHRFQTRAFVVMWWPHKSAKSRRLRLHLHSLATSSLLQLQILVPWPPFPLSSHPFCHPALNPRGHRNSNSTPSPLSSRTLSHIFLNPSRSRIHFDSSTVGRSANGGRTALMMLQAGSRSST
jgi:hypothetical protein